MQTLEQLSPTDAQGILDRLPQRIRTALTDDLYLSHRSWSQSQSEWCDRPVCSSAQPSYHFSLEK
jgi:hypothetical protein